MPAETGPILIGEPAISPLQYRYLFPDLARLPESDEAIAAALRAGREAGDRRAAGASPIRTGCAPSSCSASRRTRSPPAPPSPNWHLVPGSSGTLDVFFSHGAQAEGAFEPRWRACNRRIRASI